jgi:hypothetical protein
MTLQTLEFNTTTKSVKIYDGSSAVSSVILYKFDNVPTVKVENGYYEVMQNDLIDDNNSSYPKRIPVARFPLSNTNMIIKR